MTLFANALIVAALLASAASYFALPYQKAEPFYMMSLVLAAMGLVAKLLIGKN